MNKRFIYQDGELEKVTKEELKAMGAISYSCCDNKCLFPLCLQNQFCSKQCEQYYPIANKIATSIFEKHFNDDFNIDSLKNVFNNLIVEAREFLSKDIVLTKGLFLCIKISLISLVKNETMLEFPSEIENTLL